MKSFYLIYVLISPSVMDKMNFWNAKRLSANKEKGETLCSMLLRETYSSNQLHTIMVHRNCIF